MFFFHLRISVRSSDFFLVLNLSPSRSYKTRPCRRRHESLKSRWEEPVEQILVWGRGGGGLHSNLGEFAFARKEKFLAHLKMYFLNLFSFPSFQIKFNIFFVIFVWFLKNHLLLIILFMIFLFSSSSFMVLNYRLNNMRVCVCVICLRFGYQQLVSFMPCVLTYLHKKN